MLKILIAILLLNLFSLSSFADLNSSLVHLKEFNSSDLPVGVTNKVGYLKHLVGGGFYGGGFCSAALVAPNIALTASHCIGHNYVSKFGNSAYFELPNGLTSEIVDSYVPGEETFYPQLYDKKEDLVANLHRDIAIIFLKDRLGDQTGWLDILPEQEDYAKTNLSFRLFGFTVGAMAWGFAVNKKQVISSNTCQTEFINKFNDSGKEYHMLQGKKILMTNCEASFGLSGGPLLVYDQSSKTYRIAGVVSSGNQGTSSYVVPTFQFDLLKRLTIQSGTNKDLN